MFIFLHIFHLSFFEDVFVFVTFRFSSLIGVIFLFHPRLSLIISPCPSLSFLFGKYYCFSSFLLPSLSLTVYQIFSFLIFFFFILLVFSLHFLLCFLIQFFEFFFVFILSVIFCNFFFSSLFYNFYPFFLDFSLFFIPLSTFSFFPPIKKLSSSYWFTFFQCFL